MNSYYYLHFKNVEMRILDISIHYVLAPSWRQLDIYTHENTLKEHYLGHKIKHLEIGKS